MAGRQFFTRALDFGFSKDYKDTLGIWDHQQVVADIVRVIRTFRPDVMITRFSTQPGGTHGHHTASAVLGLEAFKIAGDPKAFPEQGLAPWQPKRIFVNGGGPGRGGGGGGAAAGTVRIDVGGNDPLTGESFGSIAGRSRAMHKTQGFGNFGGGGGARSESFQLLDGEPATTDIMDGVETSWKRVSGGAEIGELTKGVIEKFDTQVPSANVTGLLAIRAKLAGLGTEPLVIEKRRQLDHILQECLGLKVETRLPDTEVVPGETLKMVQLASIQSTVPFLRWIGAGLSAASHGITNAMELKPGEVAARRDDTQTLPAKTPGEPAPYWLREQRTAGMFRVANASLIGMPENPPEFPIEQIFEVGGQTLIIPDEPVQILANPTEGETRRPLKVIPPVALDFASEVELFAPGASRPVEVEVKAFRPNSAGTVQLTVPTGWKVTPENQRFRLAAIGERARLTFTVTPPKQPVNADITVAAEVNGVRYNSKRIEINYPHVPRQLLQPQARLKAVDLDMTTRGHQVGYVPGAGDSVADALKQMGYTVTELSGAQLTPERLKGLDAVVIGIRAFNVRTDLDAAMPALSAYAEAGGNVIVQYNRPDGLKAGKLAPFDLRLSQDRVTDETAAMTFLAPDHPALNTPNKITSADFAGWVQERGLYFPNSWDEHFVPLLACSDPGEAPKNGSLLVAKLGRGYFVYTSLAWFRQLPEGVPGAYRLFANLVSLGK